jgi:ribosome modulation factor
MRTKQELTPMQLADREADLAARARLLAESADDQPPIMTVPSDEGQYQEGDAHSAYMSGREAGLANPMGECPYQEILLAAEWERGRRSGERACSGIDPETRAWSQGWHCGVYIQDAECPYPTGTEERYSWMAGIGAGQRAAEELKKQALEPDDEKEEKVKKIRLIVRRLAPKFRSSGDGVGKTSAEVTDTAEIERIVRARNDGKIFTEIEAMFGLRKANGMTALRICKKYEERLA